MQIPPQISASSTTAKAVPMQPKITGEVMRFAGSGYYSLGYVRSTGDVVGREGGYSSLEQAVSAAQSLTSGARRPAAGVFEIDGRFHTRSLSHWFKYDDQLGLEKGAWHFEGNADPFNSQLYGVRRDDRLRALVDGETVVNATTIGEE